MARTRMVTRTVIETKAQVMCLDVTTAEVSIREFSVPSMTDNALILKSLKKEHETDTFKVVAIQSTETAETLYGMTEEDFIKSAKVLPPRSNNGQNVDTNE